MRSHVSILEATCLELHYNWTFCVLGPLLHTQQLCRVTRREGLHLSLLLRDWLAQFPHQQPSAAPVLDQTFLSRLFSFPGSFLACEEKCSFMCEASTISYNSLVAKMPYNLDFDKATWKSSTENKTSVTNIKFGKTSKVKGFYC